MSAVPLPSLLSAIELFEGTGGRKLKAGAIQK